MEKNYIVGVDGGNSKTDYFLFDTGGNFVDHLKAGTCSHERFADGYAGAHRVMDTHIRQLLGRNQLTIDAVAAGAFGLAGADIPSQKSRLCQVVERIGFSHYALDNDSFLGIKAGSVKGYGVCSINGSGTVTGGISPSGARLQVGGVGELSGDEAGGFYLARRILRTVYDAFYRMGPPTAITAPVMELLQLKKKEQLIECVLEGALKRSLPVTALMKIMFSEADGGDPAARAIIEHTARQLACSTAGCIANLDFDREVDVILAGSVWLKAESPLLLNHYKEQLAVLTWHDCHCRLLEHPPAIGAVLWALELAGGAPVDLATRQRIIDAIAL